MIIDNVTQEELATIDGGSVAGLAYDACKYVGSYLGPALYWVATMGQSTGADGY
jgi:hypothetical protein